jgi:uncharacterized membrane protein YphA (DoxX/SURF4 family)
MTIVFEILALLTIVAGYSLLCSINIRIACGVAMIITPTYYLIMTRFGVMQEQIDRLIKLMEYVLERVAS